MCASMWYASVCIVSCAHRAYNAAMAGLRFNMLDLTVVFGAACKVTWCCATLQ